MREGECDVRVLDTTGYPIQKDLILNQAKCGKKQPQVHVTRVHLPGHEHLLARKPY